MKHIDTSVLLWDFRKLFGMPCVWAHTNSPTHNPKIRKFPVSDISIESFPPGAENFKGRRVVDLSIFEFDLKENSRSGLYGFTLAETFQKAGAGKKGFIQRGSFDAFWELKRGERFTDGAIRIARIVFEILQIEAVKAPVELTREQLLDMFVHYKMPWIQHRRHRIRMDDALRKRHKMGEVPPALRMNVL